MEDVPTWPNVRQKITKTRLACDWDNHWIYMDKLDLAFNNVKPKDWYTFKRSQSVC